ncbi:MAG: DNA polymerase III subunit delta [Acidobacteria bacterium]|nr:DNA polymerase III subunit delta [Acidobacteriota bacterium]
MPSVTAEQWLAKLGKGQPIPAVVLVGSDLYLRDLCHARLLEAFIPEAARAWAVTRLSLEDTALSEALQQAQMLPMLSPRQIILVSNLEALARLGDENRERAEKELEAYLAEPAPFTILVLEAVSLDQRTRLSKLLNSAALVVSVELAEGKGDDKREATVKACQRLIPGMAKELKITINDDAAEELAEATNGDLARIRTELEKLAIYAGDGKNITVPDIDALVVSDQKSSVWQLADMLAERRGDRAFQFVDQLIREGEQPVGLIGGMAWMYRKLLEAQTAPRGLNRFAAAGMLKMRPDTAELAINSAQRISRQRLLAGLTALYDADSQLKGGAADHRAVLEFLVAQLTAETPYRRTR